MSNSIPSRDNTCAVIITYNPDGGLPARLKQVEAQFPLVIIVDNGSESSSVEILKRLSESPHVNLVENPDNRGIAAALNQGVNLALQLGYQWIVTLDQDTVLHANFIESLIDVYRNNGDNNVLIGSNYWDVNKKKNFVHCKRANSICMERKTVITSGTLVPLSLFQEIGMFKEEYFIDSVDHEFCLRARSHGCRVLISCCPLMSHSIGPGVKQTNWLRQRISLNHSPIRKYFIARNSIVTAKTYFLKEPIWSIYQILQLLAVLMSIMIFNQDKNKHFKAIIVGIIHGLTGKMGPIEKTWPHGLR